MTYIKLDLGEDFMKKSKKIISLLLSILMIITSVPLMAVNSFAADPVKSGTTGECTWTLDSDGVLTISGNGEMGKYYMDKYPSWGLSITKVVIENGVTNIGGMAFADCKSLTSVTIPDSVTSIGYRAFIGCTSLTSITIPESVTEIGEGAFWYCPSLTSVNIPDSVKSIGDHAFLSCTSLTSINIPDGVTSIGDGVFDGCTNLKRIDVAEDNKNYCSIDGVLFNKDKTKLIKYPSSKKDETYVIPDSVTSIGGGAFEECVSLTSVNIPDSVTSIGNSAFSDCTSLTSVTIPDSVTNIGGSAFRGCKSLTSITIPDSVTSIYSSAFEGCTSLTSITIPDSVISIGKEAFVNCTSLTSVTIGSGVTSIGSNDFGDCNAFSGCNSIKTATINSTAAVSAFKGNASIENIIIGNSVTEIGWNAFRGCESLTSINIPDSVTSIDKWAFENCTSLTSINIPDSVTYIGSYAFVNCNSLTSVNIPNSVTYIGGSAFNGCTLLESVTIGNGVTSIGDGAFGNCSRLKRIDVAEDNKYYCSIDGVLYNKNKTELLLFPKSSEIKALIIPDSVTSIGDLAFWFCTSLTSVTIPDSVTSIGDSAFYNCISLTSVTIPDSVTSIGDSAFVWCTSLTSITIPDSVTNIGEHAFGYYMDYTSNKEAAIEGFTIIGKPGSAAQTYAEENGFAFVCPESIKVSKLPDKTTYFIGDAFDQTGIVVSYVNNDGSEDAINAEFTITGFDSSVAGKNTITVAYDGKTATFDVEIKVPEISLSKSNVRLNAIGKTTTLTATAVPNNSEIVWKSSNESVATVENGVVTAKGAGNATITATITVNGIEYSAECTVDVKLPTMSFPDVRSGDWYSDAVKYNFERGYITGYSNGTFGPANNIQRQDFALILARIAGADLSAYEGQNGGFSDVPTNTYYSAAVAWAKDRGIVTGYSADNFGVGTYITREQISLILCRYLGGEASGDVDTILNAYPDGGNTSSWAKVGVAWAVENGIVGNAGYINPTGNAGRAEVAQIIYNMSNKGMI